MKSSARIIIISVLSLAVVAVGITPFVMPKNANACGVGAQGGESYVPQRRSPTGELARRPSLTQEQAFQIVSRHVKRLNPDLNVGQVNDAGSFFEAEIISKENEVIQLMGVDKESGRLMLIN
ncbi:MAG: hypothetical protein JRJ46_15375 [Deltaproteobacteria bacterium]|nr:hypothetical protein [Deltaproteobacteria bacterium]